MSLLSLLIKCLVPIWHHLVRIPSRMMPLLLLALFSMLTVAADDGRPVGEISLEAGESYVFSSFIDDVLQDRLDRSSLLFTHNATRVNMKGGFFFSPTSTTGRLYPGLRQGIGAGLNLYTHSHAIGLPVLVYIYQGAPAVRFNNSLSLDYEWNLGLAAGWKPCDGLIARSNLIVGSEVNAYINLGIGLRWNLRPDISLSAFLEMTHFSDGNTSFPNPGVNQTGFRIGFSRSFGPKPKDLTAAGKTPFSTTGTKDTIPFIKRFSFDLTGYGAWRKRVYRGGEEPVLLKGRYGVAGLDLASMWNVSHVFRAGISADAQWDSSTDLRHYHIEGDATENIRFGTPPFFSQLCLGLSARAELAMPIFAINVGIGYNFIGPEETRASYQMANLKILVTRRFFLNIGYQLLNFKRQNNLMLGCGYTFGPSRNLSTTRDILSLLHRSVD